MTTFRIVRPDAAAALPLLVIVPHAGTRIPDDVRRTLLLGDEELQSEITTMTDHLVDGLFGEATAKGATMLAQDISRLVVDVERFVDDEKESMARFGLGAVYTRASGGDRLRPDSFSAAERAALLDRFQRPFAEAAERLVDEFLDRWGVCWIIDAHSFPSRPHSYEQGGPRPEICIGYEEFHRGKDMESFWEYWEQDQGMKPYFRRCGRALGRNTPFAGSYVPAKHYLSDPRVKSMMIEVNRVRYLDEATGDWATEQVGDLEDPAEETKQLIDEFLDDVVRLLDYEIHPGKLERELAEENRRREIQRLIDEGYFF